MRASDFVHNLYTIRNIIFISFNTIIWRCYYYFYPNLTIRGSITFFGKPFFRNYPGGSIIIGKNCSFLSKATSNLIGINRPCILSTLTKDATIIIGDKCGFSGTVVSAFLSITIGNNVRCGANTLITDSDWHFDDPRSGLSKAILIENNVWLGEGVKVLKGVTIGENSVIGAGSVVTKSVPPNVIAAGNPCKIIKQII